VNESGALAGVRVIEVSSGIAGLLATQVLADLGAEVLLVEPPGGHRLRRRPGFRVWARGKRSACLDLKREAGRARLGELAAGADVVVTNLGAGAAARLRADAATLRARNPRLVVCSITGYGESGPAREAPGYEALVAARAGLLAALPGFRPGPVYPILPIASCGAGLLAAQQVLTGLYARAREGRSESEDSDRGAGASLEASLYAGALLVQCSGVVLGPEIRANPSGGPLGAYPAIRMYPCGDGEWLMVSCSHATFWAKLAIAMDLAEMVGDERFQDSPFIQDAERAEVLREILAARFLERPRDEWLRILEAGDVPVAPVRPAATMLDDPQVVECGLVVELNDPEVGRVRQIAPLIELSATPARVSGPAPRLGEHGGWTADDGRRTTGAGGGALVPLEAGHPVQVNRPGGAPRSSVVRRPPSERAPLAGVRVLDLSASIAGPMCPRLLADLGADVLKLEPLEGEVLRPLGGSFLNWNRGKRGLALDLGTPEGRAIVYRLVDRSDVFLENMRPGAAERLGLGYAALAARNPRLIYASISGYGSRGPDAQKPGWDPLIQARAGLCRAQGGPDNPPAYMPSTPSDYWAAALAAAGICAALYVREGVPAGSGSGRGQRVESSLLKGGMWGVADRLLDYAGMPPPPENDAAQVGPSPTYRLYEARDGWLFLAAVTDRHWQALGSALDGSGVRVAGDARFATAEGRWEHRRALGAALERTFRERSIAGWMEALTAARVPAAPVPAEFREAIFADAQAAHYGHIARYRHPELGDIQQLGTLHPLPGAGDVVRRRAPGLGEHSAEILTELGYTGAEIHDLLARRIVARSEVPAHAGA
jgi:crotonobetainyl-CoA:carnitine CoA-transferase CaiB-like acyl-CoA transferase